MVYGTMSAVSITSISFNISLRVPTNRIIMPSVKEGAWLRPLIQARSITNKSTMLSAIKNPKNHGIEYEKRLMGDTTTMVIKTTETHKIIR